MLLSGMDAVEKIYFAFSAFDFDSRGSLSHDEATLLFRSTAKGLSKASPTTEPFGAVSRHDAEKYADLVFAANNKPPGIDRVNIDEFKAYCVSHPVISNWLKSLSSLATVDELLAASRELSDEKLRNEWLLPILASFRSVNYQTRLRSLELQDIEIELVLPERNVVEDDSKSVASEGNASQVQSVAIDEKNMTSVKADDIDWIRRVERLKPEEVPPVRSDIPEDSVEPIWVSGINTRRRFADHTENFLFSRMHRSARYLNVTNNLILYSTSNHLVLTKKNEETNVWSQIIYNEHEYPISCFDIHQGKNIFISADNKTFKFAHNRPVKEDSSAAKNRVVIWNIHPNAATVASPLTVRKIIELNANIKFLDINALGSLVLVVLEDVGNTMLIYEIATGLLVFSKKLILHHLEDTIHDVKFFGTSSMIAVASSKLGIFFFINEESNLMGKNNMLLYEERMALFGVQGKDYKNKPITEIVRLEVADEIATGTEDGSILIWRGRTISQILPQVHRTPITALDYNPETRTLISGSVDGTVNIFDLIDNSLIKGGIPKGPKKPLPRYFQHSSTFDILGHSLSGYQIASIALSSDGSKALVATSTNDLVEIKCKIRTPTPEELTAAAEAGEGGEGAPGSLGKLGDDVNAGPLVTTHFSAEHNISPNAAAFTITSVARNGNGFITCGNDATVRVWQPVGGEGDAGNPLYKIVKTTKMDSGCSAVTASATNFAVALNGQTPSRLGSIHIFGLPEANFIAEISEIKKEVRDIRLSPEGNLLIVNVTDGSIYVVAAGENNAWTVRGKIASLAHPEPAERYDLSADNNFLRCYYGKGKTIKIFDINANFGNELFSSAEEAAAKATIPADLNPDEVIANPLIAIYEPLRAIAWGTNNCPYNWDVAGSPLLLQGYPEADQYQNPNIAAFFDRSNSLLVGSSVDGKIHVARAPVYIPESRYIAKNNAFSKVLSGHVGQISGLFFFDEGGVKLLSAGAFDGVLKVWKVTYDADEPEPDLPEVKIEEGEEGAAAGGGDEEGEEGKAQLPPAYDSGDEEDLYDLAKLKEHLPKVDPNTISPKLLSQDPAAQYEFEHILRDGPILSKYTRFLGYETASELSRLSAKAFGDEGIPSNIPKEDLSVHWIYGCTTRSTRNAVRYTSEGNILYPAGCLSVIYDKVNKRQLYTAPHRDVISAFDFHYNKGIAATSHIGAGNIFIFIWKSTDGSILRVIDVGKVNGISALKFSPDGHYLIAATQDIDHTIHMYQVDDGVWLSSIRGGNSKVLSFAFSEQPYGTNLKIVQGGVKHYKVLFYNTLLRAFTSKNGLYGADVRKSHVITVSSLPLTIAGDGSAGDAYGGNEFVLGFADGSIAFIARGESKIGGLNPIQKGGVTALTVAKFKAATAEEPPVYKIIVGGVVGSIKVLDQELQVVSDFNLYAKEYGLYQMGRVRGFKSLCVDKANRKILYATSGNEIGEIDLTTGEDLNQNIPVIQGHFRNKLTSLCSHPLRQECLTAGDDKTLRIWDLENHSLISLIELPGNAVSGCFAPNGHLVVVGLSRKFDDTFGGRMAVVSYLQGKTRIVYVANDAKEEIASLIFSPDGSKVYAASLDAVIYIYDALNNFQLMGRLQGHAEGVRSLDISSNGQYLISESILNDVKIWDLNTRSMLTRPTDCYEILHDNRLDYFKRQNRFGLNSLGIFPPAPSSSANKTVESYEEINSLHQSNNQQLLIVGTSLGYLKLYQNPAVELQASYKKYLLHSPGGIAGVQFTTEDRFVLSVGKSDKLLIQWRINAPLPSASNAEESNESIQHAALIKKSVMKPPVPEDIFESSFSIRNISFADTNNSWKSLPSTTIVQLSHILGAGNHSLINHEEYVQHFSTNPNSIVHAPRAFFVGHGEILTSFGKQLTLLEGNNHAKLRIWNNSVIHPIRPTSTISDFERAKNYLDITATAVSPNGRYVAVGYLSTYDINTIENQQDTTQVACPLHLYSAPNGELISEMSHHIPNGVQSIAFSANNHVLACLGRDLRHSIYVFQTYSGYWNDSFLLYSSHINILPVTLLSFLSVPIVNKVLPTSSGNPAGVQSVFGSPMNSPRKEGGSSMNWAINEQTNENGDYLHYDFVTAGKGKLQFWKLMNHSNVITNAAVYDDAICPEKEVTALAGLKTHPNSPFLNYSISGDKEGNILLWKSFNNYSFFTKYEHSIQNIVSYGSYQLPSFGNSSGKNGFVIATKSVIDVYSTTFITEENLLPEKIYSFQMMDLFHSLQIPSKHFYTNNANTLLDKFVVENMASDIECRQILISSNSGLVLSLSTDSGNVKKLLEGHSNQQDSAIIQMIPYPKVSSKNALYATLSNDKTIRLFRSLSTKDTVTSGINLSSNKNDYDLSNNNNKENENQERSGLIGFITLEHSATAAIFASERYLIVAIENTDQNQTSPALLIIEMTKATNIASSSTGEYHFTIVHKIHNVGNGKLITLHMSKDHKYLGCASTDGNIYLFGINNSARNDDVKEVIPELGQFFPLGYLLVHPTGAPVVAFDFAETNPIRYLRTFSHNQAKFNGKVDVNYFDLESSMNNNPEGPAAGHDWRKQCGSKINDVTILEEVIKPLTWESANSPAAPEVRGLSVVSDTKQSIHHVESISISSDKQFVIAGYHDGLIRLYK